MDFFFYHRNKIKTKKKKSRKNENERKHEIEKFITKVLKNNFCKKDIHHITKIQKDDIGWYTCGMMYCC